MKIFIKCIIVAIIIHLIALSTIDGEKRKRISYNKLRATANLNHIYATTK